MENEDVKIVSSDFEFGNRNELRAPEANEMLERPPKWLFRWGGVIVLMIFGILICISIIVRYPDTLEGSAIVTTDPLPIKLKTQSGGRIKKIFIIDGAIAQENDVIAEIENATGLENIQRLQKSIDAVNQYLQTSNDLIFESLIANPLQSLGDAQLFYNQLLQQLSVRILIHKQRLYIKRTKSIEEQIDKYHSISQIAIQQKAMIEEELKQSDVRYIANEKLYKDKVISQFEYFEEAAKVRQKKLQLEQQNSNILQNIVTANSNSKQLLETQNEREEKERELTVGVQEAVRNITNYIQIWKQKYLLIAPFTGIVEYLRPLQMNEPTGTGEELFAIVPSLHKYLTVVMLPATGIGKVRIGQKVHILLDNFPYNEFGFLEGTILRISALPESQNNVSATQQPNEPKHSVYRVSVQMPFKMETSHHLEIPFSPEMTATARIITKDRNLLQRLIAGIAKIDM